MTQAAASSTAADDDHLLMNRPLYIPFTTTSVALFVNKSPRHTHEWTVHVGGSGEYRHGLSRKMAVGAGSGPPASKKRRGELAAIPAAVAEAQSATLLFERLVSKVVFRLDKSFAVPQRTVTEPPFLTHGEGWGEHCVEIDIYFASELALPLFTARHHVLLHNTLNTRLSISSETALIEPPQQRLVLPDDADKPCVAQRRDAIILPNPTRRVLNAFTEAHHRPTPDVRRRPELSPPFLEGVLRTDHERSIEAARKASDALDQALESLRQEEADLLAQIEGKEDHIVDLLAKGRERLGEQEDRCARLSAK